MEKKEHDEIEENSILRNMFYGLKGFYEATRHMLWKNAITDVKHDFYTRAVLKNIVLRKMEKNDFYFDSYPNIVCGVNNGYRFYNLDINPLIKITEALYLREETYSLPTSAGIKIVSKKELEIAKAFYNEDEVSGFILHSLYAATLLTYSAMLDWRESKVLDTYEYMDVPTLNRETELINERIAGYIQEERITTPCFYDMVDAANEIKAIEKTNNAFLIEVDMLNTRAAEIRKKEELDPTFPILYSW